MSQILRVLRPNEIPRANDCYYDFIIRSWAMWDGTMDVDGEIPNHGTWARHETIPDKPKVRLEEFVCFLKRLRETESNIGFEQYARKICFHLNLELVEKEEWERAWEENFGELKTTDAGKQAFRLGFEAGQSCEKSRGKS